MLWNLRRALSGPRLAEGSTIMTSPRSFVRQNPHLLLLLAFSATLLATILNVACSDVGSIDTGTNEMVGSHYGYGYGGPNDVAEDFAP